MSVFRFPCSHAMSIQYFLIFSYLNPPSKASGIAVALFQLSRCNRKNCLNLFYVCDFWKSEDFQFAFHILCIGSDKIGHDFRNFLKLFFEVKKDIKKDARISPDTVVTVVNVNIKMIQKWKIKMYIFQDLFLSLCFHKGSFFF